MSREIRLVQFLMLGVVLAAAQTISGDLIVKVVDPSGAVVANSKLTLTEVETYTGTQINGYGIADYLLGIPGRAQGAIGDGSQDMRSTFYAGYLQDDWRLATNFTINVGLRYEFARSPVEIRNKSLYFNPEQARIILAGQGVRPDIVDPDFNNFAPRFGFTWSPRIVKNAVVRGGFGIFYATDNLNEEQFKATGPPFFQAQTIEGD